MSVFRYVDNGKRLAMNVTQYGYPTKSSLVLGKAGTPGGFSTKQSGQYAVRVSGRLLGGR